MFVKVFNITKAKALTNDFQVCRTFFKRLVGLLGKKDLNNQAGMILFPCASIHTFFMKFNIDVIFASKKKIVTAVFHEVKPYSMRFGGFKAYYCLEIPSHSLIDSGIDKGDILMFEPEI